MQRLGLKGHESLLDVGCGPGLLAIGFAPFVKKCIGLDPEPLMLEAAREAAAEVQAQVAFQSGRLEEFKLEEPFDIVTIGRALHWLDRKTALEVLQGIVSPTGRVLVCRPASIETPSAPWLRPYQDLCDRWSDDPERLRYRVDIGDWFADSRFREVDRILVSTTQRVSIDDLVCRALSRSSTSLAVVGDRQEEFKSEIRNTLAPFAQDGMLEEEIVAAAAVYGFGLADSTTVPLQTCTA